ncbi:MAG: DUF418 domain-containing protein [Bacteroidota bacterium]
MSLTSSTPPGTASSQSAVAENDNLSRIFSLDVLRGIALLGILVVSIWQFAGFTSNQQFFYQTGTHGGNYKLLTAISMLFEGKMLSLFALVFGAGIILFLHKKEYPVKITPADAYMRRQIWLIIFGVFNAFILLWPGDILFPFGVVGILVFAFTRMKPKGFFIAAIVCTLVYAGKQYWNYADDKKDYKKYLVVMQVENKFKQDSATRAKRDSVYKKDSIFFKDSIASKPLTDSITKKNDTLTKKQAGEKDAWEGTVKELKYDSSNTKVENKLMRSRWNKVAYAMMARSKQKESGWLYRIGLWDIASMMFLGMALLGIGFFQNRLSGSSYFFVGILLTAIGLALAYYRVHYNNIRLIDYAKYVENYAMPYDQFFPVERMLLATGYASLIIWLMRIKVFHWFWRALAATGRMAFTNYIMQSVICGFFFYGYGFGYFGRLTQSELYFMVAEITLVQVVFSVFWLRYYIMGPVEWLLRCLIYRKWLPLKKPSTQTTLSS